MDAIEHAIRNAFAKGDPSDPAFREKVYRSAYAALERALQSNQTVTPEAADRRRKGIIEAIGAIEAQYAAQAQSAAAPSVDAPHIDPPLAKTADTSGRVEPAFEVEPRRGEDYSRADLPEVDRGDRDWPSVSGAAPTAETPAQGPLAAERMTQPKEPSRRRALPWGALTGIVVVLVVAVLGIWTVSELGLIGAPDEPASPSASAPEAPGGPPRRPGEVAAVENWVTIFTPADASQAVASSGASAQADEAAGEQVMRIAAGTSGAPVSFDLGEGVLERIAGKRAVFDIVARAGADGEAQMSVSCKLGSLGDCGRNRYSVGPERAEYLFEVDVPAGNSGGAGSIDIVSDVASGGRPVEIYEIRVTTVDEPASQ